MSIQYSALDRTTREIRLLKFIRTDDSRLEFLLENVREDECPSYHCLSYLWGDPSPAWPVTVNRVEVLIPHNLGQALSQVSTDRSVEFLWADAICINQNDQLEKEHQISMMGQIYENAEAVLAWLGPETNSSRRFMEELSRAGDIIVVQALGMQSRAFGLIGRAQSVRSQGLVVTEQMRMIWRLFGIPVRQGDQKPHKVFQTVIKSLGNHTNILAECWDEIGWSRADRRLPVEEWAAFLSNDYWRRVWIVQELAKAREVYLLLGSHKATLYQLLAIKQLTTTLQAPPGAAAMWFSKIGRLFAESPIIQSFAQFSSAGNTSDDILELLNRLGNTGATQPQDRVFALSALTSNRLGLEIKYSLSLREHLEILTRNRFLASGIGLPPLELVKCPWAGDCPSWVIRRPDCLHVTQMIETILSLCIPRLHGPDQASKPDVTMNFGACGPHNTTLSPDNFPRLGIFKAPCWVIGQVKRHQTLISSLDKSSHSRLESVIAD